MSIYTRIEATLGPSRSRLPVCTSPIPQGSEAITFPVMAGECDTISAQKQIETAAVVDARGQAKPPCLLLRVMISLTTSGALACGRKMV
jgi:hypothetical protein